mgnify:CR=1 FL=1
MEKKFRIISIIFILGSILVYGARFGYYYIKYNKKASNNTKSEVLSMTISKNNKIVKSDDGLYNNNGELVFKGTNVNNYLIYSNILWRIVKVNNDNSVVLITDSKLTDLAYVKDDFLTSDINDWLNKSNEYTGIFIDKLNDKEKYLVPTTICLDDINNLKNITCHKKETEKYVSLLNVADYLNSKNEDSYINNTGSLWTVNKKETNKLWYISEGNLSNDLATNIHGIKPVITLKNTIGITSGDGTKNNPYRIEKEDNNIKFNSYVKLGNDLYTVYDSDNEIIKLVNTNLVNDNRIRYLKYYNNEFDTKLNTSIANYLNTTYYNSLTYKNNLIDCTYYTGDYKTSYKDIYNKNIKTKVGLLSISDINMDNTLTNYFLLNRYNNVVMSINDSKEISTNKIRPTVCISKTTKLKGNGTINNPFELEA